jgi:hypothetical protein
MVENKKNSINIKLYVIYGLVVTLLIILIGAVVITSNSENSALTSTDRWEMTLSNQPVHPTFGCANFIPVIIIIIGIITMIVGWLIYKDEEEKEDDDL